MNRPYSVTTIENGAWLLLNQLIDSDLEPIPEINMRVVFNYFNNSHVLSVLGPQSSDQNFISLLSAEFAGTLHINALSVLNILQGLQLGSSTDKASFFNFATDFYKNLSPTPECLNINNCLATTNQTCSLSCLYSYLVPNGIGKTPQCFVANCNSKNTVSAPCGTSVVALLNALNGIALDLDLKVLTQRIIDLQLAISADLSWCSDGYILALETYLNVSPQFSTINKSLTDMFVSDLQSALITLSSDGLTVSSVTPLFKSFYRIVWQIYCEMCQDSQVAASPLVKVKECDPTYACPCKGPGCTLTGYSQYFGLCESTPAPTCQVPCNCTYPPNATPVGGTLGCCPSGTTCALGSEYPTFGAVCACCGGEGKPNETVSCGDVCFAQSACGTDQEGNNGCCFDGESWLKGCRFGVVYC